MYSYNILSCGSSIIIILSLHAECISSHTCKVVISKQNLYRYYDSDPYCMIHIVIEISIAWILCILITVPISIAAYHNNIMHISTVQ